MGWIRTAFNAALGSMTPSGVVLVVIVIALAGFAALVVEAQTGQLIYLSAAERQVSILKELHDLEQSGIGTSAELAPIYRRLVSELAAHSATVQLPPFEPLVKFVGGAFPGVFMAVYAASQRGTRPEWKDETAPFVVQAALVGAIGAWLPTVFGAWWVNVALYVIVQFAVILIIGTAAVRREEAAGQAGS